MNINGEPKMAKVAFLFKKRRSGRLDGSGPQEFLYGLPQLRQAGWAAESICDDELGLDRLPSRNLWAVVNYLGYLLFGIPLWALWQLSTKKVMSRLNGYDAIVVTTNTFGICLGVLQRVGLLRCKLLYVAMGLIEPATARRIVCAYRIALRGVSLCAVASADAAHLSKRLRLPVSVMPFGVDTDFWHLGSDSDGSYAVSIGSDRHRDYATLVAAWKPAYPELRIVTKLPVNAAGKNIEVIHGDGQQGGLDDEQLRTLVQRARFVVLSIRDTIQPSGQSVCLQAMACGKAVVITDYPGLWNRELLRNGETCVLGGPPGTIPELQRAVERLLNDPELARRIGERAMQMVRSRLNVEAMSKALETRLLALLGETSRQH